MDRSTISLIFIFAVLCLGTLLFGKSKVSLILIFTIICLGIGTFLYTGNAPFLIVLMIFGLGLMIFGIGMGKISLIIALIIFSVGLTVIYDIGMRNPLFVVFLAVIFGLCAYLLWIYRKNKPYFKA